MILRRNNRQRRHPLSLTTRVMAFVAIAIGFSLLLISHLVQNAVEHHFSEQDADELKVITQSVEQALRGGAGDTARLTEMLSHAVSGHHGVYFQVWDDQGKLIFGPSDLELSQAVNDNASVVLIRADNLYRWQAADTTYRGSSTQALIGGEEFHIVAAIDMDFHILFLDNFRHSLWLIVTLAGIFTLLAAWYGVHQAHAPLRSLSNIMSDVQAHSLHVRIDPDDVPDEIRALVNSFNQMIGRLEDSFARSSLFSADIAHELRTPITNLITQTQVALQGSAPLIVGDRAMLRRAISNLLSNALRYAPAGHMIKVQMGQVNATYVELSVENTGPMIPAEYLSKIFDLFYQVDPSRQRLSGGAGLGLTIAKSIIEAHDGHIVAYSNHDVTRLTVSLPIVNTAPKLTPFSLKTPLEI